MKENPSICSHLNLSGRIYYYRAPLNERPIPRTILPQCQEIELITKGQVYFDYEGEEKTLHSGHFLWHLPGEKTVFKSELTDPYECLVLKFPFKQQTPPKRPGKLFYWADTQSCLRFVEEVLTASRQKKNPLLLRDYAYATLLWQATHSIYQKKSATFPTNQQKKGCFTPIDRVKEYIDHHFHQTLTVKQLSGIAQLSESHLYLCFKQEVGTSPHQYLLERRMEEARHLLEHSELCIKNISYQCGFKEVSNFCRIFKAHFQTTPLQFRQESTDEPFFDETSLLLSQSK